MLLAPLIIDMHTHIAGGFSERFAAEWLASHYGTIPAWFEPNRTWRAADFTNIDPEQGLRDMEKGGVSKAVTWGINIEPSGCHTPPERVAELQKRFGDKLIGFHCADAFRGGREAARQLDYAVRNLGLKGVKLFPSYNWVYPNDPRLFPIYAKAEELNVPCVVHTALAMNTHSYVKYEHPFNLDEVCQTFSDLKVIVAHFGFQFAEEVLTLMMRYRNMYADLAAFAAYPINRVATVFAWAKKIGFIPRILFGSDWPLRDPASQIAVYRRLPSYMEKYGYEPALTEDDLELILGGNAAKLLELPD